MSLKNGCEKVGQCALYMCGLLVDKEESLVKDANISLSYLEEVKEDRMSKLIINDVKLNLYLVYIKLKPVVLFGRLISRSLARGFLYNLDCNASRSS